MPSNREQKIHLRYLARTRCLARGPVLLAALLVGTAPYAHETSTAAAVLAPGYSSLQYAAPVAGTYQLPPIEAAADAPFTDSSGQRGTLHALFAQHVTLLSFIYTQCDDVNGCPLATFVMAQIAKGLTADPRIGPNLRLISFSFDPNRDTPEALERYARQFRSPGIDWKFVTSPDTATLARTLNAYQQSVQQIGGHAYSHILRVFLIDKAKKVRNIYSTSFLHADTVAADIQTILREESATADGTMPDATLQASSNAGPMEDPRLGLPPRRAPEAAAPKIALGERLFFDPRLSLNHTISCAMCHVPAQGFTANELATPVGIGGRTVKRNAPTLLNVGQLSRLFFDARESRLEQQVWGPLLAPNEMGNPSIGYVVDNLTDWPQYRGLFEAAFGSGPTMVNIGQALAAYERTLIAGGSPFDRWYYGKDVKALAPAAQRGFDIFRGKGHCSACHTINKKWALFTDEKLHNTGLGFLASMSKGARESRRHIVPGTTIDYTLAVAENAADAPLTDLGRYEITQNADDRWKFRTPTLRNIALTRPYMHNGTLSSLEDVVNFYNRGGIKNDRLDPLIRPLGLSAEERTDLVAFLNSLTSPAVDALADRARRVAIGNSGAGLH